MDEYVSHGSTKILNTNWCYRRQNAEQCVDLFITLVGHTLAVSDQSGQARLASIARPLTFELEPHHTFLNGHVLEPSSLAVLPHVRHL